jgi:hypothetical protein
VAVQVAGSYCTLLFAAAVEKKAVLAEVVRKVMRHGQGLKCLANWCENLEHYYFGKKRGAVDYSLYNLCLACGRFEWIRLAVAVEVKLVDAVVGPHVVDIAFAALSLAAGRIVGGALCSHAATLPADKIEELRG